MKLAILIGVSAAALLVWQAWHKHRRPEPSLTDHMRRLWGGERPTVSRLYETADDRKIRIKGKWDRQQQRRAARQAATVRPFRRERGA